MPHAAGKSHCHIHKDSCDLPGSARNAAESHQCKGSCHSYAGANISVDHHDDDGNGCRHDG